MHCPKCSTTDTKVIDSRLILNGKTVRRRRQCESCEKRFTTYEKVEVQLPLVTKNHGRIENFNREKVLTSIKKACHKRPIDPKQINELTDQCEKYILENFEKEVASEKIGKFLMDKLLLSDPVAYVRFASFYWNYDNIDEFIKVLQNEKIDQQLDNSK